MATQGLLTGLACLSGEGNDGGQGGLKFNNRGTSYESREAGSAGLGGSLAISYQLLSEARGSGLWDHSQRCFGSEQDNHSVRRTRKPAPGSDTGGLEPEWQHRHRQSGTYKDDQIIDIPREDVAYATSCHTETKTRKST